MIFDPVLTRLFLIEAFDETEFDQLCQQYFRDVYDRFNPEMIRSERVHLLVNHCERFGRFPQLMAVLESTRPEMFKKRFQLQV